MKKQAIFISTLVVLLFASCASEQQLARRFIREANTYNIAVEFPQQLFLTNSKVENLYPNFQEMDSEQQNELLVRHTQFLNNLNEADLRTSYCSTFVKTLQELKLNVIENAQYPDSTLDNTLLNVRMLQLEWEEDRALMRYSRSISYYEDVYKDLTVNELNLNVWLEYTAPNAKPKVKKDDNGRYYVEYQGEVYYWYESVQAFLNGSPTNSAGKPLEKGDVDLNGYTLP